MQNFCCLACKELSVKFVLYGMGGGYGKCGVTGLCWFQATTESYISPVYIEFELELPVKSQTVGYYDTPAQ